MNTWRPSAPPPQGGWQPQHSPSQQPASPGTRPGKQRPAPRRSTGQSQAQKPAGQPQDPPSLQGPEALQHVLRRSRHEPRFEAPVIVEEHVRAPIPRKTVLLVFAAVMVLAVAAGAIYALLIRRPTVDEATIVQPSEGASSTKIRTPQEVVSEYLHALADGDITTALSLGPHSDEETSSKVLLTPAAHSATRERSPIEDIQILTDDPKATQIEVSYQLAGKPITTVIPVILNEHGSYELERTTVTVVIELVQADALPLQVNGIEVPKLQPIEVVPGIYELSTGLPFIEFPAENNFTIGSLQFAKQTSLPATPRLSDAGREAFRAALQSSLTQCTAMKLPSPQGCPQGVRPAKPLREETIRWSVVGNPLSGLEPSLSTDDLSVAIMALEIPFTLTFQYADGSSPGVQELNVKARATANMLAEQPDQVTITWHQ